MLHAVESYHGERHAVDLMFVFGLVLPEGTVPIETDRQTERQTDRQAERQTDRHQHQPASSITPK